MFKILVQAMLIVAIAVVALASVTFIPGDAEAACSDPPPGRLMPPGQGPVPIPARSNRYVGEPTVSNTGRVTHDLTDMYGNSYNYNDDQWRMGTC